MTMTTVKIPAFGSILIFCLMARASFYILPITFEFFVIFVVK